MVFPSWPRPVIKSSIMSELLSSWRKELGDDDDDDDDNDDDDDDNDDDDDDDDDDDKNVVTVVADAPLNRVVRMRRFLLSDSLDCCKPLAFPSADHTCSEGATPTAAGLEIMLHRALLSIFDGDEAIEGERFCSWDEGELGGWRSVAMIPCISMEGLMILVYASCPPL